MVFLFILFFILVFVLLLVFGTLLHAVDSGIWFGGDRLFVAVADIPALANNRVMTSSDGISPGASRTSAADHGWTGVTYGNGLFVHGDEEVQSWTWTKSPVAVRDAGPTTIKLRKHGLLQVMICRRG